MIYFKYHYIRAIIASNTGRLLLYQQHFLTIMPIASFSASRSNLEIHVSLSRVVCCDVPVFLSSFVMLEPQPIVIEGLLTSRSNLLEVPFSLLFVIPANAGI